MTPDEVHAADIAHGAVVGRLKDPEFDPGEFVRAELTRLPAMERGPFLVRTAVAAVSQHAGTLVALQQLGLNPLGIMARAAELRDLADQEDTPPQGRPSKPLSDDDEPEGWTSL